MGGFTTAFRATFIGGLGAFPPLYLPVAMLSRRLPAFLSVQLLIKDEGIDIQSNTGQIWPFTRGIAEEPS